jgi:hypothetical protein
MEAGADENVFVGSRAVGAPGDAAVADVQRRQAAPDAELRAAVANQHVIFDRERCDRHRFAVPDLAGRRLPRLLAGFRVDSDRLIVQGVVEDLSVGIARPLVDDVAAGNSLSGAEHLRPICPFERRARPGQVERVEKVRVRRDDVQGVADDQRGGLMAPGETGREREADAERLHVAGVDLVERAIAGAGVVFCRPNPLAIVRLHPRRHLCADIGRARGGARPGGGGDPSRRRRWCFSTRSRTLARRAPREQKDGDRDGRPSIRVRTCILTQRAGSDGDLRHSVENRRSG